LEILIQKYDIVHGTIDANKEHLFLRDAQYDSTDDRLHHKSRWPSLMSVINRIWFSSSNHKVILKGQIKVILKFLINVFF